MTTYQQVKEKLKSIAEGIAATFGGTIEMEQLLDYPSLLNDKAFNEQLTPALESVFGKQNVVETAAILAGEDFAFYSRKIPSMFYFLGARNNAEPCFFLHHPKMIVNEACIKYGAQFLSEAAITLLK